MEGDRPRSKQADSWLIDQKRRRCGFHGNRVYHILVANVRRLYDGTM